MILNTINDALKNSYKEYEKCILEVLKIPDITSNDLQTFITDIEEKVKTKNESNWADLINRCVLTSKARAAREAYAIIKNLTSIIEVNEFDFDDNHPFVFDPINNWADKNESLLKELGDCYIAIHIETETLMFKSENEDELDTWIKNLGSSYKEYFIVHTSALRP